MDSLSPESRALYEILMADTTELYESKFAAYKKDRLDAIRSSSHPSASVSLTPTRSTASPRAPSCASPTGGTPASAAATAAPAKDLRPVTPSTCSMLGLDDSNGGEDPMDTSLTPWSAPPSSNAPPDDLARPLSAPMGVLELFMLSPSTCLTECPGSHVGALPAVCLTPHATLSPATSSVAVTAVQRHVMMSTTGEKLEIGEAPMSMEDTLQIVPIPADVSGSNMELTLMSPASYFTGCSNGAVASTESNHSVADTAQSIINVERVDLAIVTVPRNMTLTAISAVAGQLNTSLLAGVAIQNGSSVSLEPNSCIFSKVFAEKYSVTAVVPRSLILVVTCDEAVLWPILQSATSSTDLLLPWDPGQPWYGGGTKLGTLEDEFASGVACLQGKSMHQLFNCSLVVEMVKKWTIALVELLQILPILGSYCLTSNHYQWVPELLQFHSLLDSWFHFEPAGKASLYGYNAAQFQWEIAWPTTTQTQSLIASTSMDRLLDLLLARRDIVQQSTSLSGFIAILNGEAEVQWNYSCTRILTDNVLKEWIYCHILRILMEACSPCVVPGRGYNWQMLGSTTENTTMILQFLHILRGNTHHSEIKPPWPPPLGMCLNLRIGNIPSSHGRVVVISLCTASVLRYLNRGNSVDEPKPPWSLLSPTNSSTVFRCNLITVVESLHSTGPSWELFSCIAVVIKCMLGAFNILTSSVLTLKCFYTNSSHYLEVRIWNTTGIMFSTSTILGRTDSHGSKSYSYLDLDKQMMGCQIVTDGAASFGCQIFEWQIPWYLCLCHAICSSNWLQMQPVGGQLKLHTAFLFSWDVAGIVNTKSDSETSTKNISGTLSHALRYLEVGDYFAVPMQLLSSRLSEAWVLYLRTTSIIKCGSKMMLWKIASSKHGILTYTERVLLSWDLGGTGTILDTATVINRKCIHLPLPHLTWDPGGYMQHRLEGKPAFKKGGLSATSLLGWLVGRCSWAIACLAARRGGFREAYISADALHKTWLGTGWIRRLRPRL